MNRWDHLDVIVAVGICATILGASMFFFAFGGAPAGLLDQRFESTAPAAIDPDGTTQAALGRAIVESGGIGRLEGEPWGLTQTRLGGAIVAAVRADRARADVLPYVRDEARESLARTQGMIQETAGRAVVRAAQQMWRGGATDVLQILAFQETLGRIAAEMTAKARAAMPLRQEALGWAVVGRLQAVDGYHGQVQQQLGAAVRDAGLMAAMLETERPAVQESLGGAVLVAARASASSAGATPVLAASAGGVSRAPEVPYQAGVILLAALFVIGWGVRSVAESGPGLPAEEPLRAADGRYRKAG